MEDQGLKSPQTFAVKIVFFFDRRENMIDALSSEFEYVNSQQLTELSKTKMNEFIFRNDWLSHSR